jgi:hypothetical protein
MRQLGRPGAVALAVGLLLLTACVPPTPDVDTWRYDARQALSDVASEVATARLVLREELGSGLLARYEVVVVAQAEETAGKTADSFSAKQPPSQERQRYATVTGAMDDATGLLSDVRIAVTGGDRAAYPSLLDRLVAADDRLQRLERELNGAPGTGP